MLERAKAVTREGQWTYVEYVRFADDLVVLVDAHPRQRWLRTAVEQRLREELAKLQVEVNEEKGRRVDLTHGESFGFLGFEFRRIRSRRGRWMPGHATRQEADGGGLRSTGVRLGTLRRHAGLRLVRRRRPPSASMSQFPEIRTRPWFSHTTRSSIQRNIAEPPAFIVSDRQRSARAGSGKRHLPLKVEFYTDPSASNNGPRTHAGLHGRTPEPRTVQGGGCANVSSSRWLAHCRGLYQTPMAA
jgi:hypothetical protein